MTDAPGLAGKGRPTPRRAEARAARSRTTRPAPTNRKEAARQRRETAAATRSALRSTDPARLPAAERTPERILARDVVDSRPRAGPLLLVGLALYVVVGFVRIFVVQEIVFLYVLAAFLAVIIDSLVLTTEVSRALRQSLPDSSGRVRLYAARRALLPRRWRLPSPRVPARGLFTRPGRGSSGRTPPGPPPRG